MTLSKLKFYKWTAIGVFALGWCLPSAAVESARLPPAPPQGATFYFEVYPDNRPTNITNPSFASPYSLPYLGIGNVVNGNIENNGPLYADTGSFPYALYDEARDALLLHPGTFESAQNGISIAFPIPYGGYYNISGDFARANDFQYAGDGVDVMIFLGTNTKNPFFSSSIDASHFVDTENYFGGTGVSHFDFTVNMSTDDVLRFAVFSDAQGQDGTFDATAIRLTIVPVPTPIPIPSAILLFGSGLAILAGLQNGGRNGFNPRFSGLGSWQSFRDRG